ncbi:hypothetical protein RIB2604_01006030 [Aspergillus luchuensis]|uniref:Uncharacterized protein n=1 Tax=Aspergillus kawachii TaxID=1069201 RepID=A0A146F802_ASPKA|nr:hypothetical protein RIB2604_01006030 [Aspergillus luchuensis]
MVSQQANLLLVTCFRRSLDPDDQNRSGPLCLFNCQVRPILPVILYRTTGEDVIRRASPPSTGCGTITQDCNNHRNRRAAESRHWSFKRRTTKYTAGRYEITFWSSVDGPSALQGVYKGRTRQAVVPFGVDGWKIDDLFGAGALGPIPWRKARNRIKIYERQEASTGVMQHLPIRGVRPR